MQGKGNAAAEFDAVIVGARCAGAATALLLARAGARVLVIDREAYGADTLSTHALMRGGVALLDRWGVLPAIVAANTPPVRTVSFGYGADRTVVPIKPDAACDALYAPRRTVLDRALVDAAVAAGASVRYGARLESLIDDGAGRICGVRYRTSDGALRTARAGLVIGADGRNSTVARLTGAATIAETDARSALIFGYFGDIPDEGYRWRFVEGSSIGAVPTNDGLHCVFAAVPHHRYRDVFDGGLMAGLRRIVRDNDPSLAATLEHARLDGDLRRFGGAPGRLRQACGPGWALVGDAGYFKDPITAHGLTDALRDAALLSDACLTGGEAALPAYQAARDRLSRPLFDTTAAIAGYRWDLNEIRALHERLHRAMKSDLEVLNAGVCAPQLAA